MLGWRGLNHAFFDSIPAAYLKIKPSMTVPFYGQTQMAREVSPDVKSLFFIGFTVRAILDYFNTHDKHLFTRSIREFIEAFTHDRI